MKLLDKGLVICITGHSLQKLKEYGHYESMKTVMLGDRMHDRVKEKDFVVLDSTTKMTMEKRLENWDKHMATAFEVGRTL